MRRSLTGDIFMSSYRFVFEVYSPPGPRGGDLVGFTSRTATLLDDETARKTFSDMIKETEERIKQGFPKTQIPNQLMRIDQPEVVTVLETRS